MGSALARIERGGRDGRAPEADPVAVHPWERSLGGSAFAYVEVDVSRSRLPAEAQGTALVTVRGLASTGGVVVLACRSGNPDDRDFWLRLFHDLRSRGLKGVRVIAGPAHRGAAEAAETMFASARWRVVRRTSRGPGAG